MKLQVSKKLSELILLYYQIEMVGYVVSKNNINIRFKTFDIMLKGFKYYITHYVLYIFILYFL